MDPQQWLQNYQKKIAGVRRASEQLKENLGNAVVTMSSPDEAVTVTIGPNGSLKNLQLSHRAAEHSPQQLGGLIMNTVRRAQRVMAERVIEAVTEFGGGEGDATRLLRNYLPEDPDDRPADDESVSSFEQDLAEPPAEEPRYESAAPVPAAPAFTPPAFTPPAFTPPPASAPGPTPASRPRAARAGGADDDEFEEDPW
jgi:DNA-binding protein YbaB